MTGSWARELSGKVPWKGERMSVTSNVALGIMMGGKKS